MVNNQINKYNDLVQEIKKSTKEQEFTEEVKENLENDIKENESLLEDLKTNENVGDRMENRFVCAHSSNDPRNVSNINLPIIEALSKLSSAYKNTNDQWRCFAYDKAISSIRRHPTAIGSRAGK